MGFGLHLRLLKRVLEEVDLGGVVDVSYAPLLHRVRDDKVVEFRVLRGRRLLCRNKRPGRCTFVLEASPAKRRHLLK